MSGEAQGENAMVMLSPEDCGGVFKEAPRGTRGATGL